MKNKKILIIIVIVAAVLILGGTLVLFFKDISAKNALTREINSLSDENIDMTIKTKGNYAKVEKAVKEDYKAYFDSTNKLRDNYNIVADLKVLNIENYKNDGPEFTSSLETLNKAKQENSDAIATLNDLIDSNKIEERALANELDGKYKNLYKEILEQIQLAEGVNKIKETDSKYDAYISSLIDVLSYMRDNKSEWFIENDTLKSKSQNFIDTYNQKVDAANIEL